MRAGRREIERLKAGRARELAPTAERERKEIADAIAQRPRTTRRVSATGDDRLRIDRDLEGALMTTPTVTETVRNGNPVGKRTELGRYTITAGERVLYGQRIAGVVRVTDGPASGRGRAVLVERGLEQDGYAALLALVADYIRRPSATTRFQCSSRYSTEWVLPQAVPNGLTVLGSAHRGHSDPARRKRVAGGKRGRTRSAPLSQVDR